MEPITTFPKKGYICVPDNLIYTPLQRQLQATACVCVEASQPASHRPQTSPSVDQDTEQDFDFVFSLLKESTVSVGSENSNSKVSGSSISGMTFR